MCLSHVLLQLAVRGVLSGSTCSSSHSLSTDLAQRTLPLFQLSFEVCQPMVYGLLGVVTNEHKRFQRLPPHAEPNYGQRLRRSIHPSRAVPTHESICRQDRPAAVGAERGIRVYPLHPTEDRTECGSSVSSKTCNGVLLLVDIPQVALSDAGVTRYLAAKRKPKDFHTLRHRNLQLGNLRYPASDRC